MPQCSKPVVAPIRASTIMHSCVRQMCWFRYRIWKGLDVSFPVIFYSAVVSLVLLLVFVLFVFSSSAFIEGRRYTCIYMSILCHIEASKIYNGALVAV
jgi:hypothetical protein